MSRVGKNPVAVPSGVTVAVDGRLVTAKGKLGELKLNLVMRPPKFRTASSSVRLSTTSRKRGCSGTTRNLVRNMVQGVPQGFKRNLEINGVGYRAAVGRAAAAARL